MRFWRTARGRAWLWQGVLAAGLLGFGAWLWGNLSANLERRRLDLGFGFLSDRASVEFGDNLVGYAAGDSYAHAFAAGLANTLQVAVAGIVLATLLGFGVALMRLSANPLVARVAWAYVEVARNTPLLLQLLFWHQTLVRVLPGPRQAWSPLPDVFVSNRGVVFPAVGWQPGFGWALLALGVGVALAVVLRRRLGGVAWLLPVALSAAVLVFAVGPVAVDRPVLRGFNFRGGATVSPEFVALLWGLVFYQGAFAAETIRSGIQGVPRGTVEAAQALGLRRWATLRTVIVPQALRIVVPPMAGQYMSLTKNSSLAVAIGYPDLVRVSVIAISETGRAVEGVLIVLSVYLTLSLTTAALMNAWNARLARRGAA